MPVTASTLLAGAGPIAMTVIVPGSTSVRPASRMGDASKPLAVASVNRAFMLAWFVHPSTTIGSPPIRHVFTVWASRAVIPRAAARAAAKPTAEQTSRKGDRKIAQLK